MKYEPLSLTRFSFVYSKGGLVFKKMMQNQPIIENIREGMNLFYNTLGQEKVDCFIRVKQINSGFMPLVVKVV